jgi:transglutaminase-like putative cysteine protease
MSGHVRLSVAAWVATVLGSMVLVPVFSGPYLIVSAFVCAVVTGTGVLLQHLRAPRLLIPLAQLVVLAEGLSLAFLSDTLRFGLIPWRETVVEFNGQLVDAMSAINRYSAPLPPEPHLTIFAASVVGLTGLVIHLIAVQFRQAAWSGLLLLMMYTVPAATVHGGLSGWWFVPPATGYIVLLSAEGRSRLTRWGRRISGIAQLDGAEPVEASALAQAGRRIGLIVIAIAALVPAMLPTLPENVFGNGLSGGTGGSGIGAGVQSGDPFLDMGRNLNQQSDQVALTYRGTPTYFRMSTLDRFDGRTWRSSERSAGREVDGELAPPPGWTKDLGDVPKNQYEIRASKWLRYAFLPVPYPPQSISVGGKWRYDPETLDIRSGNNRTVAGLKYNVTSYNLPPSEDDLRNAPAGVAPDDLTLEVPEQTPAKIRKKAADLTARANGNPYLQAVLLQDYFRDTGGFTYNTAPKRGTGLRALEDFLFEDQTGFCEQFATAMALMARTLNIPARVAVGFLPGRPGEDEQQVIRMKDMHAWPELYFQGIGWVRFEPTPATQTGPPPEWTQSATGTDPSGSTSSTPTVIPSTDISTPTDPRTERPGGITPEEEGTGPTDTAGWWSHTGVRLAVAGAGLALLLAIPWLVRVLIRRRRFSRPPGPASVEGLWAEIRDTARDAGLTWSDTATPRQLGSWLRSELDHDPEAQTAAIRLARGVESTRYAGLDSTLDLREPAAATRAALWAKATRWRRWRTRLLPPSYRWYLSRGSTEASDLLDQFDLALARLRGLLTPRRNARHAR